MMPSLHLGAVAAALDVPYSGPHQSLKGVAIDSRRVRSGDLFVALRGERVDGHDFIEAAAAAGAAAVVVEKPVNAPIPALQVSDALAALSEIGRRNRDAYEGELLAITGSCGKTSVKNLCRSIFSAVAPTVATDGNYNNEIGVPLTLSRLDAQTRYAVIEMGATRRGDIAHLCSLARPRVSTVLNAMEAHLDGFGSVAEVADVKAEIYDQLGSSGFAALNIDERWAPEWRARIATAGASAITYGLDGPADISASEIKDLGLAGLRFRLCIDGEKATVHLALPGRHNLANALAAAALARACEVPMRVIAEGLGTATAEPGRLQARTLADGTVLIDDSYNANPGSVRAAIDLLSSTAGRCTLVLGEMLELGENSAVYHHEMGELALAAGVDRLVGVGSALAPAVAAFGARATLYADRASLLPDAARLLADADVILVKGSRGAAMEAVLDMLRNTAGGAH